MPRAKRINVSKELATAVWNKTAGRCWYCGSVPNPTAKCLRQRPNIEHQQPHSKGGSTTFENLVLSCGSCNMNKHRQTLEEFRKVFRPDSLFSIWLILQQITNVADWEDGLVYDEMFNVLNEYVEHLQTRSVTFYGETIGNECSDYCI